MFGHEPPIQRRSITAVRRPVLRHVPGEVLAALAAADDDDVVAFRLGHHVFFPLGNGMRDSL